MLRIDSTGQNYTEFSWETIVILGINFYGRNGGGKKCLDLDYILKIGTTHFLTYWMYVGRENKDSRMTPLMLASVLENDGGGPIFEEISGEIITNLF